MLMKNRSRRWRVLLWLTGVPLLFASTLRTLSHNPPGFYVDESGIAYNAYLVAHTGAGEFGRGFHSSFGSLPMVSGRKSAPRRYLLSVVFSAFSAEHPADADL